MFSLQNSSPVCSIFRIYLITFYDMDIALWERYLDVIIVESLVDALHYLAIVPILREHIDPNKNL